MLLAAVFTAVDDGEGAGRCAASAGTWSRGMWVAGDGLVLCRERGARLCRWHRHSSTVQRVVSASLQLRGGGRVPASMKRMRQKEAREQVRAPSSVAALQPAQRLICAQTEKWHHHMRARTFSPARVLTGKYCQQIALPIGKSMWRRQQQAPKTDARSVYQSLVGNLTSDIDTMESRSCCRPPSRTHVPSPARARSLVRTPGKNQPSTSAPPRSRCRCPFYPPPCP